MPYWHEYGINMFNLRIKWNIWIYRCQLVMPIFNLIYLYSGIKEIYFQFLSDSTYTIRIYRACKWLLIPNSCFRFKFQEYTSDGRDQPPQAHLPDPGPEVDLPDPDLHTLTDSASISQIPPPFKQAKDSQRKWSTIFGCSDRTLLRTLLLFYSSDGVLVYYRV